MISLAVIERESTKWDFLAQFETSLKVRKKNGDLIRPVANIHQERLNRVVKESHRRGCPCRIVALKPRQKGSSTGSVGIGHVRLKAKPARGLIAGGKHFQGANLFEILKTYVRSDERDPESAKAMDMEVRYKNGSIMQRITLANGDAGRSGTYQFLTITEASFLRDEGVANADVVFDGLLKCVPLESDTIIIVESTANGAAGKFYEMWQAAITIDEFLSGKQGYVQVFSAWYEFDDSRLDPVREGIVSEADFSPREREYLDDVGQRLGIELELDQVAWMRYAVRDECGGDWDKFIQDYPSDPETAFLTSGRCQFDALGLAYQESLVPIRPRVFGQLQHNERADVVSFIPTMEDQAMCVWWEGPKVGCRYWTFLDSASGEDQTGSENPDSHALFVGRDGYIDADSGRWYPPAIVMRNMLIPGYKPKTRVCWWANDVLQTEAWKMMRYYGNTMIVPEENHDKGLIEWMKQQAMSVYTRWTFNHRHNTQTPFLGWRTDPKNRPAIIESFANVIRVSPEKHMNPGEGFEVRCPWAIDQMKHFSIMKSGRAEALSGYHDDDVMALCIGFATRGMAQPYAVPVVEAVLPRDLQRLIDIRGNQQGSGTYS